MTADRPGPTDPAQDAALRRLLDDAVADVVPADRLGEIRRATAQASGRAPRRWTLVLAAGTATAAVVAAGALVGQLGPDGDGPADAPGTRSVAVATYFLGDSPDGQRLFREFQAVTAADDPAALTLAALRLVETDAGPNDPDYGTIWPDGSFLGVTLDEDAIRIEISPLAHEWPGGLPSGLVDTTPSIQQVVHTAQAAVGRTLPVAFETGGVTLDQVLSGPVSDLVLRDATVDAPVNISDPAEAHSVDDLLTVRGVVGAEARNVATVSWELRTEDGAVALTDRAPVEGGAWEQTTDISAVPAGTYLLVASVPGTEDGDFTDTRTLVVR